jgi:hypothetical protein
MTELPKFSREQAKIAGVERILALWGTTQHHKWWTGI